MENCSCSLCADQMPLCHRQTAILRLLGGLWWPLRGSRWVLKDLYCHQMIAQTIPGATAGFQKRSNFEIFSSVTKQTTQQQIWAQRLLSSLGPCAEEEEWRVGARVQRPPPPPPSRYRLPPCGARRLRGGTMSSSHGADLAASTSCRPL